MVNKYFINIPEYDGITDDGFLEALKGTIVEDWADEERKENEDIL